MHHPSEFGMGLTEQQRRKIEENRRRALELRQKRLSDSTPPPAPNPSTSNVSQTSKAPTKPPSVPPRPIAPSVAPSRPQGASNFPQRPRGPPIIPARPVVPSIAPNRPQGHSNLPQRPQGHSNFPQRPQGPPIIPPRPLASSSAVHKTQASSAGLQTHLGGSPGSSKGLGPNARSPRRKERHRGREGVAPGRREVAKKVTLVLCGRTKFEATAPFHSGVIETFKTMPTRSYDPVSKKWCFDLSDHESLVRKLSMIKDISLEPLPRTVAAIFASNRPTAVPSSDLSSLDSQLVGALMPFQREGVNCGIARGGRLLLADEMGLGKTIQAIALAFFYRREWPLLIVAPSSVRYAWREQFLRWTSSITASSIFVMNAAKDFHNGASSADILVMSYELVSRCLQGLKGLQFRVIIMDESHFLKNSKSVRTKACMPLLLAASRVFLLSGTPALSRPCELFTQVHAVQPKLFASFHEFGVRYCEAQKMPWGWNYSGCSNMGELQLLLEDRVMIRRTKEQVLQQLPEKRREMIVLDPQLIKKASLRQDTKNLLQAARSKERHGALLQYFCETAKAKIDAVRQYVQDLLEGDKKFLVFAHHQEVLDGLMTTLEAQDVSFIRIDGKTPSERRRVLVERFQLYEETRVALLSITAASAGINLTAATLVVFAELFWNPGILMQAEDRCYRIGQKNCVNVQYLVANGTADDFIWPLVQEKLNVLGRAGLHREDFREADTTHLGAHERKILDYFRSDFLEEAGPSAPPNEAEETNAKQGEGATTTEGGGSQGGKNQDLEEEEEEEEILLVPESPESSPILDRMVPAPVAPDSEDFGWMNDSMEEKREEGGEAEVGGKASLTADPGQEDFGWMFADAEDEWETGDSGHLKEQEEQEEEEEDFAWMAEEEEKEEDFGWMAETFETKVKEGEEEKEDFGWMEEEDEEWCVGPASKKGRFAS